RDALTIRSRSPFEGAEVMNMSPAVAEELSLEGAAEGVVVASVGDGSTAAEVGVQKGDIVVAVNGLEIGTTRDLEKACAERARLWDLTIQRGGETIRTRLGG
ncbi:MAG TPA: PDZ domain-containing protein, partial [Roseiarcus sp.]|nr:PDZ domain-containing protein [Roseiarcus sp.]